MGHDSVTIARKRRAGAREKIPRFIEKLWDFRASCIKRFPRLVSFLRKHGIWVIIISFFILYAMISLLKHMNFKSHAWDLGIFDQTIWQYSRFQIGYNSIRNVPVLLADHWHPSLFLFAPFYWIWSDARTLLILQALIAAMGALPIYWITKKKLQWEFPAQAFAVTYLIFWGTMELVFFDFHPHVLYPGLIALAYYFILEDRMVAYFLCLPLLLIIQEQVALTVAFLGLYLIIFKRKWFAGTATFSISLGWFLVVTQKLIPALTGGAGYIYNQYYWYLGDTIFQAGKHLLLHPLLALKLLVWPYHKISLILGLLTPFLFLPLFAGFSIIIIPDILQRLYSDVFEHWEMSRHYNAIYAAVFLIAILEVLPRFYRWLRKRYPDYKTNFRKVVFALCIVLVAIQVPFTFTRSAANLLVPSFYYLDSREKRGYEVLGTIPPDASVCAQDVIVPHLSHRDYIYLYDGDTYDAEYVLVNAAYDWSPFNSRTAYNEAVADLEQDKRYEMTDYGEGWLVFHLKSEQKDQPG